MRTLGRITLCLLAGAGAMARTGEDRGGPFAALEASLRAEAKGAVAAWERAEASERPAIRERLDAAYAGLHDLRHYRAFGALWDQWKYPGETIEVLYPASGAHLAPLELIHRGDLRRAVFTYTEVDAAMIPRLEANLRRLADRGFYTGLASAITPLPATDGRGIPPPRDGDPVRIQAWVRQSIEATGDSPPLVVSFSFRYRTTDVLLHLVLKGASTSPGSTPYYRGEDLARADLAITHDLSYDPRENLAFLRSCIESSLAVGRGRPLAVILEDLRQYPAPLDLAPFGVRAETRLPYGHSAFIRLPDDQPTEYEDGPPLYEGAVLLEPDLPLWRHMTPEERTALFNLVLFRDHGFDRRNVNLVDGRRVEAPAILDWYMGFGHRDIEGRDLRGRREFLSGWTSACLSAAGRLSPGPVRNWLCSSLEALRTTLQRIASRDPRSTVREAAAASPNHPFLATPETRAKFGEAVAASRSIVQTLQTDASEAAQALKALEPGRLRRAGCAGPLGLKEAP